MPAPFQPHKVISQALVEAIPGSGLSVSDWADTYRYLPPERSAKPGRWSTDFTPYLRDIMDAVTNPEVEKIVFMASSQIGKTACVECILGYHIHREPCPILFVAENEGKGRAWIKESFEPTIRDTPVLSVLMDATSSRDRDQTIEMKKFPGGYIALAWATSDATLSSRPVKLLLLDEVDAYKAAKEGNPVDLAEARLRSYAGAKMVMVSSPRFKDSSMIEAEYQSSYAGKYFVPCPHCGEFQTLQWKDKESGEYRIIFDTAAPKQAYYACVNGCIIQHHDKREMLDAGEWRFGVFESGKDKNGNEIKVWRQTENGEGFNGTVGFWINELYSPFPRSTWGHVAERFLKAKNNPTSLQTFVNTTLAETWSPLEAEIELGTLPERLEHYNAEIPAGVLVLTAGVDVQGNRLEYEIVGWGLEKESWSITHGTIFGDPSKKDAWEELKLKLTEPFEDENGRTFLVKCAGVDSGGHHTEEVYEFCRRNAGRKFFAVKGANTYGKPIISKPTPQGKPPVMLYTVGTETAKDTFSANLQKSEHGPGYCHFPNTTDDEGNPIYDENYFRQLVSERPVTKYVRGVKQRIWEKIKQKERNEALDLRVYAMAALAILNPNFRKIAENLAAEMESAGKTDMETVVETPSKSPKKTVKRPFLGTIGKKKGFIGGWK